MLELKINIKMYTIFSWKFNISFADMPHLKVELSDPDGDVELVPEPVEAVLHLGQVDGVGAHVSLTADTAHRGSVVDQVPDLLDIAEYFLQM